MSEAYGNVARGAYEVHKKCFPSDSSDFFSEKLFLKLALAENGGLFCEFNPDNGEKCSGYLLYRLAGAEAEILSMGVLSELRGKGVGRAILGKFVKKMKKDGIEEIFLEVSRENRSAIGLYRRAGSSVSGARKGYYARPGKEKVDALIMKTCIC